MSEPQQAEKKMIKVHVMIEEELYKKLWELAVRRFTAPSKKLHIILNEAIREYVEKHSS